MDILSIHKPSRIDEFLGNETEKELLVQRLCNVTCGLTLVRGSSGTGKTTLCNLAFQQVGIQPFVPSWETDLTDSESSIRTFIANRGNGMEAMLGKSKLPSSQNKLLFLDDVEADALLEHLRGWLGRYVSSAHIVVTADTDALPARLERMLGSHDVSILTLHPPDQETMKHFLQRIAADEIPFLIQTWRCNVRNTLLNMTDTRSKKSVMGVYVYGNRSVATKLDALYDRDVSIATKELIASSDGVVLTHAMYDHACTYPYDGLWLRSVFIHMCATEHSSRSSEWFTYEISNSVRLRSSLIHSKRWNIPAPTRASTRVVGSKKQCGNSPYSFETMTLLMDLGLSEKVPAQFEHCYRSHVMSQIQSTRMFSPVIKILR